MDTFGTKNKKQLNKGQILCNGNYDYKKEFTDEYNRRKNKRVDTPPREELKSKLWELKNYTQVANHYNVSQNKIRSWCREYNLPATINIIKHTSELGWQTENWNDYYHTKKFSVDTSKPCDMLDADTEEFIMRFSSRKAAARYLEIPSINAAAHIGDACRGKRKTAYGYKWRDVDAE